MYRNRVFLAIGLTEDEKQILRTSLRNEFSSLKILFQDDQGKGLDAVEKLHPLTVLIDASGFGDELVSVCQMIKSGDQIRPPRIIVIAGKKRDESLYNEAIESGADLFLRRPLTDFELRAAVKTVLAFFDPYLETRYFEGHQGEVSGEELSRDELQVTARKLKERVKELNCLYAASSLLGENSMPLNEIMNALLLTITSSWQYPEKACARILYEDKEYKTRNYRDSIWKMSAPLFVEGKRAGILEVCYTEEMPEADEGPFLKEERALIDELSKKTGQFFENRLIAKRLLESREYFRITLNSIGDGVIAADNTGRITVMNPQAEKFTGWKFEQAKGKPSGEVFHIQNAKTGKKAENPIDKVLETGRVQGLANHTKLISRNGEEYHIADSGAPIMDAKGKTVGVVMVFRNVTDEYHMQEHLKESERQLKKAQAIGRTGSWKFELNTGRVIASDEALKIYGVDPSKPLTIKEAQNIPLHGYREMLDKELEGLIKGETDYEVEFRIKRPSDGRIIDIYSVAEYDPRENSVSGIIMDVTAKKQADKRLRLLSHSVEQSPVSIVITDRKGNIEYVNSAFEKQTGHSFNEVKGKTPGILNSGHHPESFFENLWKTILSGKAWQGEVLNKKKDGELFWENIIISPIMSGKGHISHFISVRENVTEKKKMLRELVVAKERAEESDRLKSAFLANMSHEIRTPMNGILGFLSLLEEPKISSEQRDSYFEIVKKSSERLLNTINDIIEISKIESGQVSVNEDDVNINEILHYFYDFYKPEAEKKELTLKSVKTISPEQAVIRTDKNKLESILSNFISNSLKFTSQGYIEIGSTIEKENVLFYVKDTGTGIPGDRIEAVFDRFVQADLSISRSHEGSGLGLSISKAYAELLGGEVNVESEYGKGSVFYLSLPVNKMEINPESAVTSGTEQLPDGRGRLILVADDDYNSFLYFKYLLSDRNYKVIRASNGAEAVRLCRENQNISIVLMDIKMPVLDGYEATRRIREFNRELPIIAQTAFVHEGDTKRAIESGCNDYLDKPIKKKRLLECINRHQT